MSEQKCETYEKGSDTTCYREVTQPSTDVVRDCLISRFGVDGSSPVWPLHTYIHTQKLKTNKNMDPHLGMQVMARITGLAGTFLGNSRRSEWFTSVVVGLWTNAWP